MASTCALRPCRSPLQSGLQFREPDASRRFPYDQPPRFGAQRQRLGEDTEMLRIGDVRSPQIAGKATGPNATFRPVSIDHLQTGIVQVRTGEAHFRAGTDEIDLGVQILEPGQAAYCREARLQQRAGFHVHTVAEPYRKRWESA